MLKDFDKFIKEHTTFMQVWTACIWFFLVLISLITQIPILNCIAMIFAAWFLGYIHIVKQEDLESKKEIKKESTPDEYNKFREKLQKTSSMFISERQKAGEEYYKFKETALKYFALFKIMTVYSYDRGLVTYHFIEEKEKSYIVENKGRTDQKIYSDAFTWGNTIFYLNKGEIVFYNATEELINNNIKIRLQFFRKNRITVNDDILWFYNIFGHDYHCVPVTRLHMFNKYPNKGYTFEEVTWE